MKKILMVLIFFISIPLYSMQKPQIRITKAQEYGEKKLITSPLQEIKKLLFQEPQTDQNYHLAYTMLIDLTRSPNQSDRAHAFRYLGDIFFHGWGQPKDLQKAALNYQFAQSYALDNILKKEIIAALNVTMYAIVAESARFKIIQESPQQIRQQYLVKQAKVYLDEQKIDQGSQLLHQAINLNADPLLTREAYLLLGNINYLNKLDSINLEAAYNYYKSAINNSKDRIDISASNRFQHVTVLMTFAKIIDETPNMAISIIRTILPRYPEVAHSKWDNQIILKLLNNKLNLDINQLAFLLGISETY